MTLQSVPVTQGELDMEQGFVQDRVSEFKVKWLSQSNAPSRLTEWLHLQYVGELDAVASMERLLQSFCELSDKIKETQLVERVISDERRHVSMIERLLRKRGVVPVPPTNSKPLPGMESHDGGSAIASRAEAVRAGHIRIVLGDPEIPDDVKDAFTTILQEEAFHERAFRALAGEEKMLQHRGCQPAWC